MAAPGSPIPGILQARTLEWVAISFSNATKWKVKLKLLSRVQPSATPWTAACQASPSITLSESLLKLMSIESVMPSNHLILCHPLLLPPSIFGILQARTLEWVAIFFSNARKWKVKLKLLSRVRHLATSWTAAYQAPPSMGFSRQEYWSGVSLPSLNLMFKPS